MQVFPHWPFFSPFMFIFSQRLKLSVPTCQNKSHNALENNLFGAIGIAFEHFLLDSGRVSKSLVSVVKVSPKQQSVQHVWIIHIESVEMFQEVNSFSDRELRDSSCGLPAYLLGISTCGLEL